MKTNAFSLMLLLATIFTSCSSDENEAVAPPQTLASPVLTYAGTIEMAYLKSQNSDPECFLNLTNGETYKVSEGAANNTNIDMTWGSRAAVSDQKYLVSPTDEFVFFAPGASDNLWQDHSLYANWGARNVVSYWDFNRPGFDQVVTNADFDQYTEGITTGMTFVSFEGTQAQMNRPIFFETSRGEKHYIGVLKFTSSDLNNRKASFTIKLRSI